jgi:hypothetical protein
MDREEAVRQARVEAALVVERYNRALEKNSNRVNVLSAGVSCLFFVFSFSVGCVITPGIGYLSITGLSVVLAFCATTCVVDFEYGKRVRDIYLDPERAAVTQGSRYVVKPINGQMLARDGRIIAARAYDLMLGAVPSSKLLEEVVIYLLSEIITENFLSPSESISPVVTTEK